MDSFFEQARVEEGGIGGEAVKFLAEAVGGEERAGSLELGFAEDEGEDRDVEIDGGDAEETRRLRRFAVAHVRENFGGMILLPGDVVGEARVGLGGKKFARNQEFAT